MFPSWVFSPDLPIRSETMLSLKCFALKTKTEFDYITSEVIFRVNKLKRLLLWLSSYSCCT